jgi:hypothetical protein
MERDTVIGEELKALKLEPGGVYVLEYEGLLSRNTVEEIMKLVNREEARAGVKFILLHGGLRIAREAVNAA